MNCQKSIFLFFTTCLFGVQVFAQDSTNTHIQRMDSAERLVSKRVDANIKTMKQDLKTNLLPISGFSGSTILTSAKSLASPILGQAQSALQPLHTLTKLFDGGQAMRVGTIEAEASYTYFHDTSGMMLGVMNQMSGMVGYSINGNILLQSIPFNASIKENNGVSTLDYTPFSNFYKFQFDRQKYLDLLKQQVMAKISPDVVAAAINNKIKAIQQKYEQMLEKDIADVQKEYQRDSKSMIVLPPGITNLSVKDMSSLQHELISESENANYAKSVERYQESLKNKQTSSPANQDSILKESGNGIKRYEALQKIYSKILLWKQRMESNKTLIDLKSRLPFSEGEFKKYLSDPANLQKLLGDEADLAPLQKLFSNIKTFDAGQNAVQSGDLNMQNIINTGVNTEFQNRKMDMGFIAGKNNLVNPWLQAGLTSALSNQYSSLFGLKLGTGTASPFENSLSVNFFNINNQSSYPNSPASGLFPAVSMKNLVFSFRSKFVIAGKHNIGIEISKSLSAVQSNGLPDSLGFKSPPSSNTIGASPNIASLAGRIDYNGEIFKTKLKLLIRKVGLGYENPGNSFLRKGETEIGFGAARNFIQNKLTVKYDLDYRDQVFDPSQNYTFSTFTNKMQAAFKINKSDKIKLLYQQTAYHASFYGQPPMVGGNAMVQLDASYKLFVKRKKITSHTSLVSQQINLPMQQGTAYSSSSLLLTHTSAMQVKKGLLSVTITDNQSNNNSYYFNTSMFSSETEYSYQAGNNLRMSSGMGYYSNTGWNQQLGLKQQLSTNLNNKLSLDLQAVYKKAILVIRPELANQFFINSSVHYHFK